MGQILSMDHLIRLQTNKARLNAMTYSFTAFSILSLLLLFCVVSFFMLPYADQGFNPLG